MRSLRCTASLSALGFLLTAGQVVGDGISFDSRDAWQAWTMPMGAVEITDRGRIRLVPVRKGIDAVADVADFEGGIRGAGSNIEDADLLMDGDVSTAWKPRFVDDGQDWWVELDLGRVVTADEIRIRLAEDADPMQFLRVLISNGETVFTNALVPVEGTLVFGKSERFGFNEEYELVIPLQNEPVRVVRIEALEKTEGAGVAEIIVRTPGDNISLGLIERGGSIVLDTDLQQILSGSERIADGDLVTFWAMTVYHQTQGEQPINRRSRFANFFWYQIFVSDGSLASDGSLRWEEVVFQPDLPENTTVTRRFDHTFDLRKIRYLRHFFPSSDGGQRAGYERFGLISEYQVYGDGFPAEARLLSPLIDLGQRSNVTSVTWDSDQPAGTRLEVRSRTGDEVQEEDHFFNKAGKEITQRKWEKTPSSLRGPVKVTPAVGSDWSVWSDPYVVSGEYFRSPSPRRYTQLQVRLMTDDPAVAPALSALHLDVGNPMAVETSGEIYPSVVRPGEKSDFTFFMRPLFDTASQGVDRLQLVASVPIEFTRLTVGERFVDGDVEVRADGFVVKLPERLQSEELVQVSFRSTIYQSQTRFDLFLGNSTLGDQIRQRVDAGDASDTVDSETISVALPITSELLSNLILSSRVLTPNGDGIGDRLEIEFDLLKVMTPRPVEAVVYDLAGRRVQTLELAGATAGHHVLSWNGRDDRDVPVPPGSYLLRVRVEGDAGTQVFDRLLAVAY